MPDGGRCGRVNVVCVYVIACVGEKEGKIEEPWGLGKGFKSEVVDSEHRAGKGRGSQLHTKSHHSQVRETFIH